MAEFSIDPQLSPSDLMNNGCDGVSVEVIREIVGAAHALTPALLADLAEDVRRRLEGRPYLFITSVADISDALAIIQCLQAYEQQCDVALAQVLRRSPRDESIWTWLFNIRRCLIGCHLPFLAAAVPNHLLLVMRKFLNSMLRRL